jgi:hypothetical protein
MPGHAGRGTRRLYLWRLWPRRGRIPEVHADGEIWAETLWDLRRALGSRLAESLVTRAMELSPANPSMLDERNAILQADQAVNRGTANGTIWQVFAHRGMGHFAGSVDGDDLRPAEDFSMPPAPGTPTGSMVGTVTDVTTGEPLAGALVGFGGHASGFPGDLAATTDAAGHYEITGIVAGTYPRVFGRSPGYDVQAEVVSISSGRAKTVDFALRRDWAALGGGGEVVDFNGPDFSAFSCGPRQVIDQSLGVGWNSTSDFVAGVATPKFVVIKLPVPVNDLRRSGDRYLRAGQQAAAEQRSAGTGNHPGRPVHPMDEHHPADPGWIPVLPRLRGLHVHGHDRDRGVRTGGELTVCTGRRRPADPDRHIARCRVVDRGPAHHPALLSSSARTGSWVCPGPYGCSKKAPRACSLSRKFS